MQVKHLGKDVWYIHQLGYFGTSARDVYGQGQKTLFDKNLSKYNRKHLITFTANQYQKGSWDLLKKAGFKQITTFRSAHGGKETLTFWLKNNQKAASMQKMPIDEFPLNCSITPKILSAPNYYGYTPQCAIKIGRKPKGFVQVGTTPIFVDFRNKSLKKDLEKQNPKKEKQNGKFEPRKSNRRTVSSRAKQKKTK